MSRLSDELKSDLAKEKSKLKTGTIVGALLLVFVLGYLHFAFTQFKLITNPDELAGFTAGFLSTHVETVVDEVGKGAKREAPAMVSQFYSAVGDGIGAMRHGLQTKIGETQNALGIQVTDWATDYFARVVKENQQLKGVKSGEALKEDAFAGMAQGFERDLNEFFADSEVDDEVGQATILIKSIADRLQKLANGKGLSSQEKEERDLLIAWFQMVAPEFEAPTEPLEEMEQTP